jgi:hypothetical protein
MHAAIEIFLVAWTFAGVVADLANLIHAIADHRKVARLNVNHGRRFAALDEIRRAALRLCGTQIVLFSMAVIVFVFVPPPTTTPTIARIAISILFFVLPATQGTQALLDLAARHRLQKYYRRPGERRSGIDRRRPVGFSNNKPYGHDQHN